MATEIKPTAKIYYSAKECGFVFLAERAAYDAAGTWPSDAIAATEEEWRMYGQQPPPPGMRRGSDEKGLPAWVTPKFTQEEAAAQERAWRDRQLGATDALVTRHRDELEAERDTSLSAEQYRELQAFRWALRDWPGAEHFPELEHRPVAPPWLSDEVE